MGSICTPNASVLTSFSCIQSLAGSPKKLNPTASSKLDLRKGAGVWKRLLSRLSKSQFKVIETVSEGTRWEKNPELPKTTTVDFFASEWSWVLEGARGFTRSMTSISLSLFLAHLYFVHPSQSGALPVEPLLAEKVAVESNAISSGSAGGIDEEVGPSKWMGYRIPPCKDSAPCVSTSSFMSPSRYLPPWSYIEGRVEAFRSLQSVLNRMGGVPIYEEAPYYLHYRINYAASDGLSKDDYDDLEFLFKNEGIVFFRSVSENYRPDPPFCWWRGCINGPQNRYRLEQIRDELGWTSLETDEEKKWVPLLLH